MSEQNTHNPPILKMIAPKRLMLLAVLVIGVAGACLITGAFPILTPDQAGYRQFKQNKFNEAAKRFSNPMWKGAALYNGGDFKQAAAVFSGYDTSMGAFNHGNSLVMQGKYEDAIARYERALVLQPGWEAAEVNLEIARKRADRVKQEGGDMTGGTLAPDEIVFSKTKSSSQAGDEEVDEKQQLSDTEMRAVWLRNVQTKPADFLRAKFAYQQANAATMETSKNDEKTTD